MEELIKQPNGKFCSMEYNGKMRFVNYTEEDVINMYIEQAKKDMKNAERCEVIIERLVSHDKHNGGMVDKDQLASMGFDRPYSELVKYIPRKPLSQHYVGHDCTTYGKCPNCGKGVQDGIGHKDKKCGYCSQLLKW